MILFNQLINNVLWSLMDACEKYNVLFEMVDLPSSTGMNDLLKSHWYLIAYVVNNSN